MIQNHQPKTSEQEIILSESGKNQSNATTCNNQNSTTNNESFEILILNLIYENNYEDIQSQNLHKRDLNYLTEFQEVALDTKISPLILACFLGRWDVIKILLMNDHIDLNLPSYPIGLTPLIVATMSGYLEITQILVDVGANVNQQDTYNHSPIECCFNRLEEEQNWFENQIICLKMADILIESGAEINYIVDPKKGYNLLLKFCSIKHNMTQRETQCNYEVIKFLLENGADRDLITTKNQDIYQILAKHPNQENVFKLLETIKPVYQIENQNYRQQMPMYDRQYRNQQECILEGAPQQPAGGCCSIWSIFSFK